MTSTPPRAARSVAIETTSGIARPSACGQAITSTVIVRTTASSGWPSSVQTIAVIDGGAEREPEQPAGRRSARRCARDDEFCASATSRWMPASAVSSPTAVTSTRRPESVATVPATTGSPGPRRTGRDSPVIIDSSTSAVPSTTWPSAGTRPPGRTTTTSPTPQVGRATGHDVRRRPTRSASSGSSAASESSADVVCASERISIQWPSSMITIRSASSHQKSSCVVEQAEARAQRRDERDRDREPDEQHHAGLARPQLATAPVRNGRPPQTYMTVPSTGEIHATPGRRAGVAEDRREHARKRDDRDREDEHDPEQPAELADVVAVAAVAAVLGVGVVSGVRVVCGLIDLSHGAHHIPHGGR